MERNDTHRYRWPVNHWLSKGFMWLNTTLAFIIIGLAQIRAEVSAQSVSLNRQQISIEEAFAEVNKQTGYQFLWLPTNLRSDRKVDISVTDVSLASAIETILTGLPLTYEFEGKTILIKEAARSRSDANDHLSEKGALLILAFPEVKGRVVDSLGNPLSGASIRVLDAQGKRTVLQSQSDRNGEFVVHNVPEDAMLEVSYVGYITKTIKASGDVGHVTLRQVVSALDETVVIGYGVTSKRLATGNIATIDAKTIEQQPVTNALQTLNGRVAGVQIIQNNPITGTPMNIRIRGVNSLSASNRPLFVIDDVPFPMDWLPSFGYFSAIEPTNIINPNDIETITILKDADATAIYGSRGANGVILITTKKAQAGKTKLDVSWNRGFSDLYNTLEVMNTEQYLQMRRDAFANSGTTPTANTAPDLLLWDPKLDNNIQEWYMGNTADIHDAAASFSGGNQQTQFLLSGTYHQESNVFSDQSKYRRGNVHFTANHTSADKRLKISFQGLFGTEKNRINRQAGRNPYMEVPNYPYFDEQGNSNWLADLSNIIASGNVYSKLSLLNLNMSLKGTYELSDKFSLIANFGSRNLFNNNIAVNPGTAKDPSSSNPFGNSVFNDNSSGTILAEPQLNYKETVFNGKLNVLFGSTIQRSISRADRLGLNLYLSDLLMESRNGGTFQSASTDVGQYNFLSFFGRLNYDWQGRYLLNATLRRDGSGRFGPNKRFGNFGSFGAAWILSNEQFILDHPWISYAKLRGSYGTTGSDGIGDFGYLSLYAADSDYGTQKAIYPSQIANPDYRWEVTKKLELAAEFGIVNDRLLANIVWYRNRSGNQLITYPLPTTTGFSGYTANLPAVVQNSGWELELNSINVAKPTFSWQSALTLTIPRNELFAFPNIEQTSFANTHVVGKPLNSYLVYKLDQIDPATGLATVIDVSGNGVISANSSYNNRGGDKVWTGSANPDWFAGLTNSFSYRGVQLDVFWQYTKQVGYNLFSSNAQFSTFGTLRNVYAAYADYWIEPGQQARIPKPFSSSNNSLNVFAQSDRTISDASFLRLKTVSISYQLPTRLVSRVKASNLQLTLQGQNLWTFTNYEGVDPESAPAGATGMSSLRTFSIGFKSSF